MTSNHKESVNQRSYVTTASRGRSVSREHSPSPLVLEESMEVAIKETVESMNARSSLSPPPPVVPRRVRRNSNEIDKNLRNTKNYNDEEMLHGSSEFMLVLYPGEDDRKQYELERLKKQSEVARRESRSAEALGKLEDMNRMKILYFSFLKNPFFFFLT